MGLAGIGAVAVAGCGTTRPRPRPETGKVRDTDVALLNAALAVEQRSIAAYTAAAPLLSGLAQHAANRFVGQELQHAGELRKLIKDVGGRAHNPRSHYNFGRPRGAAQLLGLLHGLEREQIAAYLHTIPLLSSAQLRQAVASILANDAQHVMVLRAVQGMPVLGGAFITAAE